MSEDVFEFISRKPAVYDYTIDQLISQGSGFGGVAGRTGLGKTNFLLNLGFLLACGLPLFGLKTKKSKVLYLPFEGSEFNLQDRAYRIWMRGIHPEKDMFRIAETYDPLVLLDKGNEAKFRNLIRPYDVILADPIKWMVAGNYTNPHRVSEFTSKLVKILRQEKKLCIFSVQVKKPDARLKVEPGDLNSIKGAGDYVEDATFTLLLERTELRGRQIPPEMKDRYLTLYFVKHREATRDLPPINLFYDYADCEFRIV